MIDIKSKPPTSLMQLADWMSAPREIEGLEFKEAKTQYDTTKMFRYCVAIANERGGKLILGVTNDPPRRVVGTRAYNNPAGIQQKILNTLHIFVKVEEIIHPDGRVVVFHIPSRHIGTACHLEGAYWMRSGDELVPMTAERLREIFDEGNPGWLRRIARDDCSGSDVIRLLDTQIYYDRQKLPYPANRDAVLERFKSEQLISEEEHGYAMAMLLLIWARSSLQNV